MKVNFIPIIAFFMLFFLAGCTKEDSNEGQILFWTQKEFAGGVQIFLDGVPYGTVSNPFPIFDPDCGEQGTVTVFIEPGTYAFYGKTNLAEWNDEITVIKGTCVNYLLE